MISPAGALRYVESRLQPLVPDTHEKRLADAIADARVLLKFSIEAHKKIPPKVVDDLVSAIAHLWPPELAAPVAGGDAEREFWNAYEALGELAAPVTARSVLQSRWQSKGWVSVTLPYAVVALGLFMFVVLLQWRWFDGTTLRGSVREHEESIRKLDADYATKWRLNNEASQLVDKLSRDLREQGCQQIYEYGPGEKRKPLPAARQDACTKLSQARDDAQNKVINVSGVEARVAWDELARVRSILQSKFDLLEEWMKRWPFAYTVGDEEQNAVRQAEANLKKSRDALDKERRERDELRNKLRYTQTSAPTQGGPSQRARVAAFPAQESLPILNELDAADTKVRDQQLAFEEEQRTTNQIADNRIERLRHRVTQRLDLLERYVFPTMLGALGSLIYILRTLISAIRDHVYTSHFLSLSIVRISLGTMAGLLGTLIFPRESLPVKDILPLAIPLLLGYAVEIFFTAMDRLVKAFSDGPK